MSINFFFDQYLGVLGRGGQVRTLKLRDMVLRSDRLCALDGAASV